jgi:hypothetical protein
VSADLCAQLAALPPVEIAGLVVDVAVPFRSLSSLALSLADCSDCPLTVRGHGLNVVVGLAFGVALSHHRERLGLSHDEVFSLSYAFAEVCDAVLGVPELAESERGV